MPESTKKSYYLSVQNEQNEQILHAYTKKIHWHSIII